VCQWALAAAVVALVASPALAQRRGGRGQGQRITSLLLLGNESVQKDLKLSDDQIKDVKAAAKKAQEARQGLQDLDREERTKKIQEIAKESDKAVTKILKDDQKKRLKQISLQVQGARAFADAAVAKELKLTADQKKKIKAIQDDAQKEITEARQDAGDDRQALQKKIAEIRKSTNDKAMKELTDDQKTKWKEMTGKKFEGTINFGGRGRRRGGQ
jgi:hypothetical protein